MASEWDEIKKDNILKIICMLFAIVIGSCSLCFSRYFCHVLYQIKISMVNVIILNVDS